VYITKARRSGRVFDFQRVHGGGFREGSCKALFTLWNCSLERPELQIMILYLNRQTLDAGFFGQPFWDSPALEHAVLFEPKIKMMTPRAMFLDNKSP
jgi:hypothetical protein